MTDERLNRLLALGIALIHLLLGAWYRFGVGISITADPLRNTWDWWWQTISIDLLRAVPLESLWHLHAQPPLHNVLGALLANLFYPHHLEALHTLHMLLGAGIAWMLYAITRQMSGSRALALICALGGAALNPALFLYEANLLYDIPTAFLLVLAAWMLVQRAHTFATLWPLYGFTAAVTALTLLRSMYHPLLLIIVIVFGIALAGPHWRRFIVVAAMIAALPFAWSAKNAAQFGFWGTSSWTGQNVWKIVVTGYTPAELRALADVGIIEPMLAEVERFSPPSDYRAYGYDQTSPVPVLSRDDYHNINIPAISATYGRGALALLRHDPGRYLRQAFIAYSIFTCPATDFPYLEQNAARIPAHVSFYADVLYLSGPIQNWLILMCSSHYLIIPISLGAYLLPALFRCRLAPRRWAALARADPIMLFCAVAILYTTAAGVFLEIPENARFKFLIEPLLWAFTLTLIYRQMGRLRAGAAARPHSSEGTIAR